MSANMNLEYEVEDSASHNGYFSEYDSENEYFSSEEDTEYIPDTNWNQLKGFVDERFPVKSLLRAIKNVREQELEERRLKIERLARLEAEQKQKELENEIRQKELEKIKYLEDSDSEDEDIVRKPVVEKVDFSFPSISQALSMKVVKQNTDASDGWKEIKVVSKKQPLENKEIDYKTSEKTKMCDSISKNITCRHGKFCRFAHLLEELTVRNCQYGNSCNFVFFKNGSWKNNGNKRCSHLHPEEDIESFYYRTGIKKREETPEKTPVHTPIRKKEKKIAVPQVVKPKTVKFVTENLETYKIREKNRINIRIKEVETAMKRNSDSISRISGIKNPTEFYKTQLSKLKESSKKFENEISTLKTEIQTVNGLKSVPKIEEPIKDEPVVVEQVKKVVKIAPVNPKDIVILYVAPKPKITAPVLKIEEVKTEVTPEVKAEEEGWIEVKNSRVPLKVETPKSVESVTNRDAGFDILKDKSKIDNALVRTKMCTFGKNCRRGKACRFAHSKKELTVSNCVFGNCCRFVTNTRDGYVNTSKLKMCLHKHPDEHVNNFYFRTGIDKVCQKY